MDVLFVASECAPFVKTGGLADVIGAVPKVLEEHGVDVRVLLPAYPALASVVAGGEVIDEYPDLFGGPVRIVSVHAEGLNMLLLDAPHLYDRPGSIYLNADGVDWPDNQFRFGALSFVASRIGLDGIDGWKPDIINAHDWQAGLIPAYLKQAQMADASITVPRCVMTIHNIAFQGLFEWPAHRELGLSDDLFHAEAIEYYGKVGFLKAGIALSDQITTVSPTYARELLTPEFGMGLDGLLRARQDDLSGILNGIDLDVWNPQTDPNLVAPYSTRSLKRRRKNRDDIEQRFGLTSNPTAPLFCVVSRLTSQKGLDLLLEVLPVLVGRGARLALLGSGDKDLEAGFTRASEDFPGSVGVIIGYDEKLSHVLQGGSDAILVPSRFEPCGLTQLYGVRYGTLPVVAKTGGLADTVVDADSASLKSRRATGIVFSPINAEELANAIHRTCDLFADQPVWKRMVLAAMKYPVGWDQSASLYHDLYKDLADSK